MILVGWHLLEDRPTLVLECSDDELVALHDFLQLLDHGLSVRLRVPLIVLEVVNIVGITSSVYFHGLEEEHEFFEVRLPVDTKDVREVHRTSAQVAQADDQQVDNILEEVKLMPMRLHRADQTHAELLRKLRTWLGEGLEIEASTTVLLR